MWSLQNKTRVHAAIKSMKEVGENPVLIIFLSASMHLPGTMILKFPDFLLNDRPPTQIRIRHVLVFVPEDVATRKNAKERITNMHHAGRTYCKIRIKIRINWFSARLA